MSQNESDLQNNLPAVPYELEHYRDCFKSMNDLRLKDKGKKICDVNIIVGRKNFRAHKIVLAGCSPYFEAMFTNDLVESEERDIELYDVDQEAIELIIEFAYTAQLAITDSNVQALLATASLLQMSRIQILCCNYIKKQLDAINCLGISYIADKYSCPDLLEAAKDYARNFFEEVAKHDEFLRLTKDQLISWIQDDSINVTNEEKVYEAVMNWVQNLSINNHEAYKDLVLAELLQHVRFAQMDPHFLVPVSCNPLIKNDEKCRELVDQAKNYLLLPDCREEMEIKQGKDSNRFKARKCFPSFVLYAVGGWVSGDAIASVERFDPETDTWAVMSPMKKPRCGVGVAVLNNVLYAVGGHDGEAYLNSIECYHPREGIWKTDDVPPLRSTRTSVGVATQYGYLYVIGGQESQYSLDLVDKYNPSTKEWQKCAPLNNKRLGAGVAVLDNYIYAVGGADKNASTNTVERYDSTLDQWQFVASMKTKRKHLGCTAYNGYIYAVGGRDDHIELDCAERYDPRKDVWESIPPMTTRRSGVGSAVINGLLYAVGGFDGNNYLKTVEVYDPLKRQ